MSAWAFAVFDRKDRQSCEQGSVADAVPLNWGLFKVLTSPSNPEAAGSAIPGTIPRARSDSIN